MTKPTDTSDKKYLEIIVKEGYGSLWFVDSDGYTTSVSGDLGALKYLEWVLREHQLLREGA
jgi:hypothetical protein